MCSGSVKVGVVSLSYGYANVNKISAAYKTAMKTRNVGGDTLASGNSASTQLAALADICAGNSKLCGSSLTNELEFVDGIPGTPLQVNHPSEVNNAAAAVGVEVSNAVAHHLAVGAKANSVPLMGFVMVAGMSMAALESPSDANLVQDVTAAEGLSRVSMEGVTGGSGDGLSIDPATVEAIAAKYNITFSEGTQITIRGGAPPEYTGSTFSATDVDVYEGAFSSEENLARTLFHEAYHTHQLLSVS